MNELKIRFSKENIKKEADLIRRLASDEVFRKLKGKTDAEIVRMGLRHLAQSGRLMEHIAAYFPRRAKDLPKSF